MEIIVHPDITEDVSGYVEEIKKNNPDKVLKKVEISLADDGESVKVKYTFDSVGFERIRRITGYLVGTLDRFNDAKRAEVEDRVKHL
jgi:anaerobic ribonucleoside-triphosphate reductase